MILTKFLQDNSLVILKGRGVVQTTIKPFYPGRVYFQATYWPAKLLISDNTSSLNPGDLVEVIGCEGLTLLVKPFSQKNKDY